MRNWKKPPLGAVIMKAKHVRDHLGVAMCEIPKPGPHTRYVVWTYNIQTGGYAHGHYTNDRENARKAYDDKVSDLTPTPI